MTERCQMQIALLSAEYPPQSGGIGDYTQMLGKALIQREHTVTVLTGRERLEPHQPPAVLNLPLSSWNWRCWHEILNALDRLRPDVLHIQYQTGAYGMHPAINLLPWRLRQRSCHPKLVVTAHDLLQPYLFPKAHLFRHWVTRRLLEDVDQVVVTNEEDYQQITGCNSQLGGGWRINHTVLIPIGSNIAVLPPINYDRSGWRAGLGVSADQTLVAYFGLISPGKGLDVLLQALTHLPQRTRLLIIGGEATAPQDRAYAATIQSQIDRLGLRNRVLFTGHATPSEVSTHFMAADVVALPFIDGASFRRGSLLAALAHGTPVVTTVNRGQGPGARDQGPGTGGHRQDPRTGVRGQRSGVREQGRQSLPRLVDGENVLLVPTGDEVALASAIVRLGGDAALRKRLGAAAQELAAYFSWEAIAEQHEQIYEELVRR